MDALGGIKIGFSLPQASDAPVLPKAAPQADVPNQQAQVEFDANDAAQKRIETITRAAQSAPQPLGSQTFTLFKDSTGQFITRFRDLNSGKVTYIPEPTLFKVSSSSSAPGPVLNIKV